VKRNPQEIWNEVVEAAASDALSAPKSIQHIIGNMASYGNGKELFLSFFLSLSCSSCSFIGVHTLATRHQIQFEPSCLS
jgi:hypothetical protein